MKKLHIILALIFMLAASLNAKFLMPNEAFKPHASLNNQNQIESGVTIADKIYLYEKFFKVAILNAPYLHIVTTQKPQTTLHHGEQVYLKSPLYLLTLQSDEDKGIQDIQVKISYQGCSEEGLCYEPSSKIFTLKIDTSKLLKTSQKKQKPLQLKPLEQTQPPLKLQKTAPKPAVDASKTAEKSGEDKIADIIKNSSFWTIIGVFFVFGLLLALTPCVFPMIPIISGVIISQGEGLTTKKAFALSLVYVLAMSLAYTIAGILSGYFGVHLQAALQNHWVVIGFSAIFVLLALSMFGFYELKLPDFIVSRVSQNSSQTGFIGVAIMGFLSALIVGPCVAAPLAGALVYIGQTGDALLGGVALFSMGLGMGLPLILVGVSAGKFMPKPGGWMTMVNATFGVIMLLVAIWMLSKTALPYITVPLYAIVGIGFALYLKPFESSHIVKQTIAFLILLYSTLLLLGSIAGKPSLTQPLSFLQSTQVAAATQSKELHFHKVTSLKELDAILQKNKGKKIMIDFAAQWCVACKEFDEETFSDPQVQKTLENFVLIRADLTANDKKADALSDKYQVFGPPVVVFLDKDLHNIQSKKVVGFMKPEKFLQHLKSVY